MKTISIFLALVNSLLAGFLIALNLSDGEIRQTVELWSLVKVVASFFVIVIGILTWLGVIYSLKPALIALSSLFLVAVGAAAVVWTFHIAITSNNVEYYLIVYGGSLMVQGAASLFGFGGETLKIPAP
jgi:hypothetical protein